MFGFTRARADATPKTNVPQHAKNNPSKAGRPDVKVGERRSAGDRRNEAGAKGKPAAPDDQNDIRTGDDRRVLRCGISIRTSGSVGKIGDWLEENCEGGTCIVLSDLEPQNGVKELNIMFELDTDKDKFKTYIKTGV